MSKYVKKNPSKKEKHYTSTVFLITKQKPRKVLLIYHKKLDKWMPPGGHQKKTENPYEAVIRETREETGIDISNYLPKPVSIDKRVISLPIPQFIFEEKIDSYGNQPEHYHLDMIYVVHLFRQKITHQLTESRFIGWFRQEEVENLPIFKNVLILIRFLFNLNNKTNFFCPQ